MKYYLTIIVCLWSFSSWGKNPLLEMAQEPSVEQLQEWIDGGADVNGQTAGGLTPLIISAQNKWHRTVQILMDNKAHINIADKNGNTALHHTAYHNDLKTAQVILAHQDSAHQEKSSRIERIVGDISKRFESNYVKINAQNEEYRTSFMIAVQEGFLEYAQLLISYKADIEIKDLEKQTSLFYAVQNKDLKMVQYLIEQEANVKAKDKNNNLPLHLAVDLQLYSIVDVLAVEGRSPLNESSLEHLPPLHTAVMALDIKMISILLQAKAHIDNVNTGEPEKISPLDLLFILPDVSEDKMLEIAKLFINKKADINTIIHSPIEKNTFLHIAIDKNYEKLVDLLLRNKAKLNVFNAEGRSPLLLAIEQNKPNIVQKLLSAGANPSQRPVSKFYFFPLHLAAYYSFVEITELLLTAQADIKIKDSHNNTALNRALETPIFQSVNDDDTAQIVQKLLSAGADPNTKDYDGATPSMKAVLRNNFQALEYLANKGADFTITDQSGRTIYDHLKKIKQSHSEWDTSKVEKILYDSKNSMNQNCEGGFIKDPA